MIEQLDTQLEWSIYVITGHIPIAEEAYCS